MKKDNAQGSGSRRYTAAIVRCIMPYMILGLPCTLLSCADTPPEKDKTVQSTSTDASNLAPTEIALQPSSSQPSVSWQAYGDQPVDIVYERLAVDLRAGKPLVVTSIVVLCDNRDIACGSDGLGDGDAPGRNLYWGARYGLKTWFSRAGSGWEVVPLAEGLDSSVGAIVESLIYKKTYENSDSWRARGVSGDIPVYLVALAYPASSSAEALQDYFSAVSGEQSRVFELASGVTLSGGRDSHVVGFVGHNYLMGRSQRWPALGALQEVSLPVGTFVLACISEPYFGPLLDGQNVVRLVMTHEFMAPEAYSLEAIVDGLAAGHDAGRIRMEVVQAYAQLQAQNYANPLASSRAIFLPRSYDNAQ